jgi:ferritin-like metal-binding protein YciE
MDNLKDLFAETLKDVYFAENAILKALPKMSEKACTAELKRAFDDHLEETKGQVRRLEEVFRLIGVVQETEEHMRAARTPEVMDAGLIGCAQAVEHYEMARYGTLLAWAEQLELDEALDLLEETLEEEEAADEKLSEIAMGSGGPNERADRDDDEDDKDEDQA